MQVDHCFWAADTTWLLTYVAQSAVTLKGQGPRSKAEQKLGQC